MFDEQENKPVETDESWKEQVKAEDAALDQQMASESEVDVESVSTSETASGDGGSHGSPPLPPADFSILVSMFSTQVMLALGMVPGPDGKTARVDINAARHFIDLLGVLEEKTKGNLSNDESEMLQNSIHYLRMAFVEQSGSKKSE